MSQNVIRTPQNLWFDISHDLFILTFIQDLHYHQKRSQNGIGTSKNLWFVTSHDPFALISYCDLQRSLKSGGQDLHDYLRSKRGLRMESEHQKTCKKYCKIRTNKLYIIFDLYFIQSKIFSVSVVILIPLKVMDSHYTTHLQIYTLWPPLPIMQCIC